jgi:hypothetical protein
MIIIFVLILGGRVKREAGWRVVVAFMSLSGKLIFLTLSPFMITEGDHD